MAYDDDVQQEAQQELARRGMLSRPRLRDRITDDPSATQAPDIGVSGPTPPPPMATGPTSAPALPPLKQRLKEALPGMIRGAAMGALTPGDQPTQMQQRQLGEESLLQRMRGSQAQQLESQRETYGLPEQQARIAQQTAQTEQMGLASKILQRRLEMMQGGGQSQLQDLNDDEQALLNSAYATGDPKVIEQATRSIYSRRAIGGMMGPGVNQYDPSAPGGVSQQRYTRAGDPMRQIPGVVVPGTLPRTTTSEQLVPTAGGGMAAVTKPSTTTPQLPGAARGGGGGGVRDVPVQPRLPAQEQRTRDTAGVALQALPDVKQQLLALRDKLGPIGGREMEIGRVIGSTDPNYVSLKTNVHLLVSALSVMHFGARGNWQWLQDFQNNVNVGAMTLPDLVAGLSTMEKWIRRYQTVGEQGNVDDQVSAPGAGRGRR